MREVLRGPRGDELLRGQSRGPGGRRLQRPPVLGDMEPACMSPAPFEPGMGGGEAPGVPEASESCLRVVTHPCADSIPARTRCSCSAEVGGDHGGRRYPPLFLVDLLSCKLLSFLKTFCSGGRRVKTQLKGHASAPPLRSVPAGSRPSAGRPRRPVADAGNPASAVQAPGLPSFPRRVSGMAPGAAGRNREAQKVA